MQVGAQLVVGFTNALLDVLGLILEPAFTERDLIDLFQLLLHLLTGVKQPFARITFPRDALTAIAIQRNQKIVVVEDFLCVFTVDGLCGCRSSESSWF